MKRLAIITLALGLASPAFAEDRSDISYHRVKAGDTFELLAAEYYQDRNDAVFLLQANKLKHPRKLIPGEKIRVPITRDIITSRGDTFESLALAYLGNPRRGTFLADFNGRAPDESLPAGTPLIIPFTVVHVAENAETLKQLSSAYFGTPKQAEMLRGYNFLDHDTIAKGESLAIPIYHVKVQAAKLPPIDAEAKQRREDRMSNVDKAAAALPAARGAWRVGDFATVRNELRGIDLNYLDTKDAVEVGVLRGAADVAFALESDAQGEFEQVLARKPGHQIRAYDYSPKIRVVWQKAGGLVDGAP
ncbi:MAG: LysM peptidoglycan-binding domain-containing protein [Deltaproteobacteria bacterium]|nr:LysM peptidoglycan-binding domain-containing protein [Deltaproteobacteria bacterium]